MPNVIVTGATSMIGVSLIEAALSDSTVEKILAVVRPGSKKINRLPSDCRIEIIEVDLNDYKKLKKYTGYETFYHLAWSRTETYNESCEDMLLKCKSIEGTLEAVEVAHAIGCKKFVWAGGQSEYGIVNDDYMRPDTPCDPVRADGIMHYATGKLVRLLCNRYKMPFILVRIFSIYGKYDRPNSMITSTVKKMLDGEACQFTPAEQIWDYLNATDMGSAFYLAGKKAEEDKIYCVGSGDARPLKEFIKVIRNVVNPDLELKFGELPYPTNPIMRLCPDISAIKNDTGWKPTVSFEEGIKEIVEYMKSEN